MRFLKLLTAIMAAPLCLHCQSPASNGESSKMQALIIDGQNNHADWPKTTAMMKGYLEETGLFNVDIARTRYTWSRGSYVTSQALARYSLEGQKPEQVDEPQTDPGFAPNFSDYDVVISNFGWRAAPWPEATQLAFEDYVRQGGGFVTVHAANNSFPEWEAYNEMIGLGGWGNRNEENGPYVYYDDAGALIRSDSAGPGGSHGPQHEFLITVRVSDHPIMNGLPATWMHAKDELYERLRGPARNMTVLATAFSDNSEDKQRSGRHEPMLMTIRYGQGRIFHTALGHTDYSVACVGFITTLQRGAEWAATGAVTQEIPADFPTEELSTRGY